MSLAEAFTFWAEICSACIECNHCPIQKLCEYFRQDEFPALWKVDYLQWLERKLEAEHVKRN